MDNSTTELVWQVPISENASQTSIAHLFPQWPDTDKMVETVCGMSVNPGFAMVRKLQRRCRACTFPDIYKRRYHKDKND